MSTHPRRRRESTAERLFGYPISAAGALEAATTVVCTITCAICKATETVTARCPPPEAPEAPAPETKKPRKRWERNNDDEVPVAPGWRVDFNTDGIFCPACAEARVVALRAEEAWKASYRAETKRVARKVDATVIDAPLRKWLEANPCPPLTSEYDDPVTPDDLLADIVRARRHIQQEKEEKAERKAKSKKGE